ncbi:MAG: serine/threonine protein kinase [Myxococcales bacterium]|nr:serine/threonine protein kinase [Myxococcales bacterium]
MATVFRARWTRTGQRVALKRVLPALRSSAHIQQLFDDECRVHSMLEHPKVVRYLAHGRDEEGAFLALEWIDGTSARTFVHPEQKLTSGATAQLALDVLDALSALHKGQASTTIRAPVLHRDISPANVLVSKDGVARLADFGLARSLAFARSTPPGTTAGKLGYLPPEVLAGRTHTTRGDLYALSVVLWEVLAGQRLFAHYEDPSARARAFVLEPRRPLRSVRSSTSEALAAVIDRGLALDPAHRFSNAAEMAAEIRAAVSRDEWSRGRDDLAIAARGGFLRRSKRRELTSRATRTLSA